MKIAIIGAGIFGITSALKLMEAEFNDITIFEKNVSILSSASECNQYRLHRGYHYPRSNEMIQNPNSFEEYYSDSICSSGYQRYYAIASKGSKTTKDQYLSFLDNNNLKYEIIPRLDVIKEDKVDLIVKVEESSFDIAELYLICTRRLKEYGIKVKTSTNFTKEMIDDFDLIINCTYSNLNFILPENEQIDYQFELVEKPVVSLGKEFQRKSIVIMDGEFCCIDPYGFDSYYHLFGHVKEAIHDRIIGKFYEVLDQYKKYLNSGPDKLFPNSRHKHIFEGIKEFFNFKSIPVVPPSSKKPSVSNNNIFYLGSMFTIRTVLPNRDHDDARPSYITKHSDQLYSVFSGKIGTSVDIAEQLIKQLLK